MLGTFPKPNSIGMRDAASQVAWAASVPAFACVYGCARSRPNRGLFFHKTAPSLSAEPGFHLLENKMLKMFFPIYYMTLCIV